MNITKNLTIGLMAIWGLSACGGGSSGSSTSTPPTPQNSDPVAVNDSASAALAESISIDVLANDTDSDGDTLTISSASASDGGMVTIADNGLTYQSADDFLGTETITYTISDGNGGDSSGTVAVDVSVTMTLSGVITDEPIANAMVTAHVNGETIETQADANGHYQLSITGHSWDDFVSLSATGIDSQQYVALVSQVGDIQGVFTASDEDNMVDRSDLKRLNVTNITTATYALTVRNNNGEAATSQTELDALEAQLEGQSVMELAAAIKSIVDSTEPSLPEGTATVLDLALDEEQSAGVIDSLTESELQALYAEMASDPELVTSVSSDSIPEKLYLSMGNQEFSYYGSNPDSGWEIQFNVDNKGKLFTNLNEPLNSLTFDWQVDDSGNIVIDFDQSITLGIYGREGDGGLVSGTQTLTELSLVKLFSSTTVDTYLATATYDATFPSATNFNRSGDKFQLTATVRHGLSSDGFTTDEVLTGTATFAMPVVRPSADKSIFSDNVTFNADMTISSSLLSDATWEIMDGSIVIVMADDSALYYEKVKEISSGVFKVQLTQMNSGGETISTFSDLMVAHQEGVALTSDDLINNYWHFLDLNGDLKNLGSAGIFGRHYSQHRLNSGMTGARFYVSNIDLNNQDGFYDENDALGFWFYSTGQGVEGIPKDDLGTFESNEQHYGYYNEWQLYDDGPFGRYISMQEGYGIPINAWGGYTITPIRRDGARMYALVSHLDGNMEPASTNITFFTLVTREAISSTSQPVTLNRAFYQNYSKGKFK